MITQILNLTTSSAIATSVFCNYTSNDGITPKSATLYINTATTTTVINEPSICKVTKIMVTNNGTADNEYTLLSGSFVVYSAILSQGQSFSYSIDSGFDVRQLNGEVSIQTNVVAKDYSFPFTPNIIVHNNSIGFVPNQGVMHIMPMGFAHKDASDVKFGVFCQSAASSITWSEFAVYLIDENVSFYDGSTNYNGVSVTAIGFLNSSSMVTSSGIIFATIPLTKNLKEGQRYGVGLGMSATNRGSFRMTPETDEMGCVGSYEVSSRPSTDILETFTSSFSLFTPKYVSVLL